MSKEEKRFCTIIESAPLSLVAGELPLSIEDNAFDGDLGRPADCGEGGAKEDRVIVDANASGLVPKLSNRSEEVNPGKGVSDLNLI